MARQLRFLDPSRHAAMNNAESHLSTCICIIQIDDPCIFLEEHERSALQRE